MAAIFNVRSGQPCLMRPGYKWKLKMRAQNNILRAGPEPSLRADVPPRLSAFPFRLSGGMFARRLGTTARQLRGTRSAFEFQYGGHEYGE